MMADIPFPRPRPNLSFLQRYQPAELGMMSGVMRDEVYPYPVGNSGMTFKPQRPTDYPTEHPPLTETPGRMPRMPGDRYSGMGQLPGLSEMMPGDYRPNEAPTQLAGDVVPLQPGARQD